MSCTKWAHFKFDACYRSQISWDGVMFTMVCISSSFQNSLKTSGHRGYEFLEFWCWNLVPFVPDISFQLLKSSWLSLTYFLFNDAPNVFYRGKIWPTGRPIQHLDSSTTKPWCCNSCSMWFCIVLLKYTSSGGEHMLLLNRYLSFSIVPSKTCKLPILYALMHPIHLGMGTETRYLIGLGAKL